MNTNLTRYFLSALVALTAFSCQKTGTSASKNQVVEKRINNYWTELNKIPREVAPPVTPLPSEFRLLKLDLQALRSQVASARNNQDGQAEIVFPFPGTEMASFRVSEVDPVPEYLLTRHPEIKMFSGKGKSTADGSVRFDLTNNGFTAVVTQPGKRIVIEPYTPGDTVHYVSYQRNMRDVKRNLPKNANNPVPVPEPNRQ